MDEEDFTSAFGPESDEPQVVEVKAEEVVVETQAIPTEPAVPTEPKVPTEADAQPAPTPPEPAAKPEPQHVPITAMLDERDKRKALEQELAQYRAQQPQAAPDVPDMFDDPEGYQAYQERRMDEAVYNSTVQTSHRFALKEHGKEKVDEAVAWGLERCNADPGFNAKVRQSVDPVGFVVAERQRDQIASDVTPEDYDAFKAWKAAQNELQGQSPASPASPQSPGQTAPPRSLASAPSAGGVTTDVQPTEEEVFDGMFKR